jgi:hypothetical protein
VNGNDAYLRCQDLFAGYPLAVRVTRLPGGRGDERSMVLLAPGEKEEFFLLCQDGDADSPFTLFPWRAQGMTLIRPDGGDLQDPCRHVLSDGVPIPRHGSLFGWVSGVSVTALISAYTKYTPRSPVPSWAVLPWADGTRDQWPPFTFEKLLGRWFWEYVRSGTVRDMESVIAASPDTVFWTDTALSTDTVLSTDTAPSTDMLSTDPVFWTGTGGVPGAGCCAVARDIRAADGLVLPRGRYVHRQLALSGTAIPPLESLLASPGRIDLSRSPGAAPPTSATFARENPPAFPPPAVTNQAIGISRLPLARRPSLMVIFTCTMHAKITLSGSGREQAGRTLAGGGAGIGGSVTAR